MITSALIVCALFPGSQNMVLATENQHIGHLLSPKAAMAVLGFQGFCCQLNRDAVNLSECRYNVSNAMEPKGLVNS